MSQTNCRYAKMETWENKTISMKQWKNKEDDQKKSPDSNRFLWTGKTYSRAAQKCLRFSAVLD